jgi:hypothetical protein
MRHLLLGISLLWSKALVSQNNPCQNCYGDKGISTNPANPQNCEMSEAYPAGRVNPFLNTWNWGAHQNGAFSAIPLNPSAGWQVPDFYNPAAQVLMQSPFYQGFLQKPGGTPITDFDYHWTDGWELLWRNTGYLPNGQQYQAMVSNSIVNSPLTLHNPRIPYFVLYNRYNGKMRIFFNVFADLNAYNHVNLDIGYIKKNANTNTSGLFRQGGGLDRPLDKPTNINIQSAHFESVNNITKWFMTEVQTAYDPCVCNYPSNISMNLWGVSSSSLDLNGRSIATTVPLRDGSGNPTYTDFLNVNTQQENYGSGNGFAIYKSLDGMLSDYDKELKEYKDRLADYNSVGNAAMRSLMGLAKKGLNAGLTGLVPSNILSGLSNNAVRVIYKNTKPGDYNKAKQWFYDQTNPSDPYRLVDFSSKPEGAVAYQNMLKDAEKYSQDLSKTLKGGLGALSDNLFATFYTEPQKPVPPTMPVATLSEMKIVGSLEKTDPVAVGNVYTPGSLSLPKYDPTQPQPSIDFNAYPAYNEPLGLFALLKTPKVMNYQKVGSAEEFSGYTVWTSYDYFKLRDPLRYRYNHSVDFDFSKTELYGQFNIVVSLQNPEVKLFHENLKELHRTADTVNNIVYYSSELISDWYPVEQLGEHYFGFKHYFFGPSSLNASVVSVKIKLLNDMYFNQLSHDGKEINSTQVLTYLLYDGSADGDLLVNEQNINLVKKYEAQELLLENEIIEPSDNYISEVVGNVIYINRSKVVLGGNISVATGYQAIIRAYWEIETQTNCVIEPTVQLEIKRDFYNFPETQEVSDEELLDYCLGQNKKYQANQFAGSPPPDDSIRRDFPLQAAARIHLSIRPNPSSDIAMLDISSDIDGILNIAILDMQGREVYRSSCMVEQGYGFKELNVSRWPEGIYLVAISGAHGSLTEKLMVQRK